MATKWVVAATDANHGHGAELWPAMLPREEQVPAPRNPLTSQSGRVEFDHYRIALVAPENLGAVRMETVERDRGRFVILPLTWKQLKTRMHAHVDPLIPDGRNNVVHFGRVHVELSSMEVRRAERPVRLTAMEFKVLRYFIGNPKRVISRHELLQRVWGYHNYPTTRTVDNHVLKLRQKLELDPGRPIHFRTMHKLGYKFIP